MPCKTITLALLEEYPHLYARLRTSRALMQTMEDDANAPSRADRLVPWRAGASDMARADRRSAHR